jgi:hypothetical protein
MELRNQVDNEIDMKISEQFWMTQIWKIKLDCPID